MEDDLLPWLRGAARGRLPAPAPRFRPGTSVCVVMAAAGYPVQVRSGDAIGGLGIDGNLAEAPPEVVVFHAGTRRAGDRLVTAGGRVLGVAAAGRDLEQARGLAYGAIGRISWAGEHHRSDIGLRPRG
jgi:phosphoribosylamine--glycine ligase